MLVTQLRSAIAVLVRRITVRSERVDIEISVRGLHALLRGEPEGTEALVASGDDEVLLSLPTQLCRVGQGKRLVIDAPRTPGQAGNPDSTLIKLLVRAHDLKAKLRHAGHAQIGEFAAAHNLSASYVTRLLRLAFLAPDITCAILQGRQPVGLTAQKLITQAPLPVAWPEQRRALGFA